MSPTIPVVTETRLPLKLLAKGKVRDVYDAEIPDGEAHAGAILFVATDRISAFDVILDNVSKAKFPQREWNVKMSRWLKF